MGRHDRQARQATLWCRRPSEPVQLSPLVHLVVLVLGSQAARFWARSRRGGVRIDVSLVRTTGRQGAEQAKA